MPPSFINNLNDVQRDAVTCTEGPVMVLAGAGSGKTRVLTYRVAYLIQSGVQPHNILALTFTNKAAREMKERIFQLVGGAKAHSLWMGTFHSIFARILKIESEKIGYPKDFTIYDTDDSKSVVKAIVREFQLDDKAYNPGYVLNRISAAKMNLINPEQYKNDPEIQYQDKTAKKPQITEIYKEYWNRCKRSAAMDFDDLLFNTNLLMHHYPEVLKKYQDRFEYILVDEYQDTNYAQYLILKRLAALRENICVVGDDAQSIYGFRGANIQNILNFNKDYPSVHTFKLEQNYRSTKTIVAAANSVIQNNQSQLHKMVWTGNDEGEMISLLKASNDVDEALLIANSIFHTRMTYHLKNSDFAVLYRTNAQSRAMEDALRKLNIPYRVYGGMSFYKRKEVRDLIAYFRIVINPNDNEAFYRIVNYPARGIGNTTLHKLSVHASEQEVPVWNILQNIDIYHHDFNASTIKRLKDFMELVRHYQLQLDSSTAWELATKIATGSGLIKELFEDRSPEGVTRYQNIESVLNGIRSFEDEFEQANDGEKPSLSDFLQMVSLLSTVDEGEDKDNPDRVSLMTVHSAKGLEFPYVFIAGLEENLFPSSMSMGSRAEIEEERRLFYVAVTRAMQKLTLSYADTRLKWGELNFCTPSRFLEELDSSLLDIPQKFSPGNKLKENTEFSVKSQNTTPGYTFREKTQKASGHSYNKKAQDSSSPEFKKKEVPQPKSAPAFSDSEIADVEDIMEGMRVEHARFGAGTVILIEGIGQNKKAMVEFDAAGQKQLVLRFARLKAVKN
ncbi:MAG: ATP-dependent DNA helicase [Bacteroidetes bacterium GWF2_43_63]|nr:MAG: ATP-dependent DNA helicase [Bacteroidetes bacterium GWE2_42_42]OFY53416.1 MAG: ATP-dependent DNA helicase [Bacteroidetes bacterium GWF2_43_63]HBG69413.1 ATP-dependent DNA helicase [Bacteroidales bacterium]HCB62032.1 ATP-dependent DNA helicase [Bacteroidales bacterium]HCY23132.1 ATP-dependent DNA helicase [Bacteroidales bacterium]